MASCLTENHQPPPYDDSDAFNLNENHPPPSYDKSSQFKEPLFKHNGKTYYGHKKIVLGSMVQFKNIIDILLTSCTLFELKGSLPEYLINMYIESCYSDVIDFARILSNDFIEFIKFVDLYPTNILSVAKLEMEIVKYCENNKFDYSQLEELCDRHRLKYLYLFLHKNKQ